MKKLDCAIPYKLNDGEELRYTLRSIEKNFPHARIFICDEVPDWCTNVIQVPYKGFYGSLKRNRFLNAEERLMCILEDPRLSEDFWYWGDDIYTTIPITQEPPVYHRGVLPRNDNNSAYQTMLTKTRKLLDERFIYRGTNYEVHMPMKMNKFKRASINYFLRRDFERGQLALMRSVYGNLFEVGGVQVEDKKNIIDKEFPFLSSNGQAFAGEFGDYIRGLFPEPSRYEKP